MNNLSPKELVVKELKSKKFIAASIIVAFIVLFEVINAIKTLVQKVDKFRNTVESICNLVKKLA